MWRHDWALTAPGPKRLGGNIGARAAHPPVTVAASSNPAHPRHHPVLSIDNPIAFQYYWPVIKTFADKYTAAVFEGFQVKRLPKEIQEAARRKLKQIDAAGRIESLRVPPSNRPELLKGHRAGQWSIRINDQWRICFRWGDGDATDVEIADYH